MAIRDKKRECPVCGSAVIGRIDKIFCCDDCRIYYNNIRYRKFSNLKNSNRYLAGIYADAVALYENNSPFLLKILRNISKLCKIISTFGCSFK